MTEKTVGIILVGGLMLLIAVAILAAMYGICWLVLAHIRVGQRARDTIDLMRSDRRINEGVRIPAYIIYYLISWTSYISMILAAVTGVWVVSFYAGKILGRSE